MFDDRRGFTAVSRGGTVKGRDADRLDPTVAVAEALFSRVLGVAANGRGGGGLLTGGWRAGAPEQSRPDPDLRRGAPARSGGGRGASPPAPFGPGRRRPDRRIAAGSGARPPALRSDHQPLPGRVWPLRENPTLATRSGPCRRRCSTPYREGGRGSDLAEPGDGAGEGARRPRTTRCGHGRTPGAGPRCPVPSSSTVLAAPQPGAPGCARPRRPGHGRGARLPAPGLQGLRNRVRAAGCEPV